MPRSEKVKTKLDRIAKLARQMRGTALTSLAHHIDEDFLRRACELTRKDGAPGVDGVTWAEYAVNLEDNLRSLLDRFKQGRYRAPPVRRVYIPKASGGKRPIGIPTLEDKILQRAVSMVLTAVYEQDFLDCSYGFRPKRSQHQMLSAVRERLNRRGGWVVELDIKSFFDTVNHRILRSILDQRVRDGVIRRMIDKWLKAGIAEDGEFSRPSEGTPQGGVVSPILANAYLHAVLDTWFERDVKPVLRDRGSLFRFADDAVLVFDAKRDAERVLEVLPKRFAKYGLTLHPDKTRLIEFPRPPRRPPPGGPGPRPTPPTKPPTFDLLGFTHYWGKTRKGGWAVKRRTAKARLSRTLRNIHLWCKTNRHRRVREQRKLLALKMRGHYGYYGIKGNYLALKQYFRACRQIWRYWLDRRGQHRHMPWTRFERLLRAHPLPGPSIRHPAV